MKSVFTKHTAVIGLETFGRRGFYYSTATSDNAEKATGSTELSGVNPYKESFSKASFKYTLSGLNPRQCGVLCALLPHYSVGNFDHGFKVLRACQFRMQM